ncbi:PREDICTED: SCO-spondin [Cercocebus atys]|uniref:SCO-spondin n=1 Tax=Cercocebus atys TaxID=9531 RepID=UPI0005F4A300|nr:PREDICTED: SCO-spondin [Cercocebus atys]
MAHGPGVGPSLTLHGADPLRSHSQMPARLPAHPLQPADSPGDEDPKPRWDPPHEAPLTGYFHSCGAAFVPRHAGSCKDKREAPHQDASFCSAVLTLCLRCPVGHFCPNRATRPIPCQPGTFGPRSGQDEATDCTPCPAGRGCTQAGLTQPDAACSPGYACPSGSSSPHAPSHACPPGTFSNRRGLSDPSQCEICPEGLACPGGTGGPNWPPIPCSTGHYCPPGTKKPTQFQCPPGTWSNQTGLTMSEECVPCPRGWFCVSGARVPSGTCRAGHYCPRVASPGNRLQAAGTKWGTQFPCPAGTYSSQAGNSQLKDCLPCPPGAFCPSGVPEPELCPQGTYRQGPAAKLAVACVPCPAGHHCPERGTTMPQPCSTGSFSGAMGDEGSKLPFYTPPPSPTTQGPGRLWCQECSGGKLCNQTKLPGPMTCPPGHYCPAQGLLSISCPMNLDPCGAALSAQGTFRKAPGAACMEDCQPCHPGTFCGKAGLAEPQVLCHPGHHCGPGSNTSSPDGLPFGDLCPPGHFCPAGTKDPRQWPCPAGTWNAERGAQDISWCLPCPPGLFCATTGQAAPGGPCAPGFHCPGGAQTPTPLGGLWEHFAGSLAPTPRQDGEHSDGTGHFCPVGTGVPLPCPVGTFSDRMFLSTASECLSCPPGYFCGASGLAAPSGPCSPGYFCLAGASSPTPTAAADRLPKDTSCAAISSENIGGESSALRWKVEFWGIMDEGWRARAKPPLRLLSRDKRPKQKQPAWLSHSGQGGPCPRGHFCPRGTSLPQPCPAGSYSYLTGQASCFPCPAGYYCPKNITNYSGHPCPAGFYCPRGERQGHNFPGRGWAELYSRCTKYATQFPCPRGYYNPDPLTQSLDSCLPCPPGHYCGQENLTRASGPSWTAHPFDLDNYTSTNCLCPATATGGKCPAGSYCPEGSPEPMPCPPGSFCGTSGLSTPSGPCQAGYFCVEGASSPTPKDGVTGAPCPPGYFCPAGSHKPMPCPAGTFSSLPEQTMLSACQSCPPGFYCKEAGLQAPSGQCPAGYYCDSSAGPIQDFSLYPCPRGHYCPLGTARATHYSCPVGTYGPRKGLTRVTGCQPCPAGKFCALAGLTAPTGDCAAGHWCKGGAAIKDPTDGARGLLCPPGHYCLKGAPIPSRCPPGTWSEEGNGAPEGCRDCAGGELCSGSHPPLRPTACHPGAAHPIPMPPGTWSEEGKWSPRKGWPDWRLEERLCSGSHPPSGPHQPLPTQAFPARGGGLLPARLVEATRLGRFVSPSDTSVPVGNAWPTLMSSWLYTSGPDYHGNGFYCPAGTGLDWQPCPPGTYGPTPGLSSLPGCQACDGGRFCPGANATEASGQCWEGCFCSRGSTRPNPEAGTEGHYCARGSAMPQPCPPGTFSPRIKLSSEAACSPCLPGHYCGSAGLTRPSGPCDEGFFCLRGALVPSGSLEDETGGPCPTGHFCPPGTVVSRPCPAGTYNTLAAQGRCAPCPQGFFCLANTSSVAGSECPAGHYCPASTAFASQFPCPRGTYKPQRGGFQQSDCIPCEPGSYCLLPGLVAVSGPCSPGFHCTQGASVPNPTDGVTGDLCPPGHFCPQGSPQPAPCPPGSFLPIPGATSMEDCQPCPVGWFCSQAGLSSPEALCDGGWYCPRASISGHSPDAVCPTGHSCPQAAWSLAPALPGSIRMSLDAASARPALLGNGPTRILFCPNPPGPGSFLPREEPGFLEKLRKPGDVGGLPSLIPDHTPAASTGAGKRLPDGPCSAGYYCPLGQTSATPTSFRESVTCGSSGPLGSLVSSIACAYFDVAVDVSGESFLHQKLGGHSATGSRSATAHPCPRGTFGPRRGATTELDCERCPAGMFCSSEGLPQPSGLCHSAHYCTGGAVSPTPIKHKVDAPGLSGNDICPPGFFCPKGTSSPVPCPPGFYSSVPGLGSKDQCQPCPPGRYCSRPGLTSTLEAGLCDAGYICREGSAVPSPSDGTHGYTCPPGFRCPPGAHRELPCEPGTFSPLPEAATCLPCPEGTYCHQAAAVEPTICPKEGGRREKGVGGPQCLGTCQPLPYTVCDGHCSAVPGVWLCRGHYCPARTSSARPCPEGTLSWWEGAVSPGACQPCPAGTYCLGEGNGRPEGARTGLDSAHRCHPQLSLLTLLASLPTPMPELCGHRQLQAFLCLSRFRDSNQRQGLTAGARPGPPTVRQVPIQAGETSALKSLYTPLCIQGPCSAGYYCEGGSASPTPQRRSFSLNGPCPGGHYCPQGTLLPVPCPVGTRSSPGATSQGSCEPCPAGSFCPRLGLNSSTGSCETDSECPSDPGAYSPKALPCPQGHFCQPGTAWPALCHRGHYQPSLGSDACLPCPPGFYCPHPGTSMPRLCPAHAYCPGHGLHHGVLQGPSLSRMYQASGKRVTVPSVPRVTTAGFYCPEGSGEPIPCPPHTLVADPGAKQKEDCGPCPPGHWCKAGTLATQACPSGHYCPGGSETHLGAPQACPEHTYLAAEGGQSQAECLPCPAGYHCPWPGLSSFEDHPCPPGHWCPGDQGAFLCPPGTFRSEPGASAQEDCELCPPGYRCPDPELQARANVFPIPCRAGSECPAGAVAEVPCRPGSYCGPQTRMPPLCPGGYACPASSSSYSGPGQRCVFPNYCPPGSAQPRACPGGSEALNGTGLRVSEEMCCRLCEAGTYHSRTLDALPCQPCPPGFSCPQGSESYQGHPCPVGHYCPAGTHSPRPCPAGTFRSSSGARAAEECQLCPADTFSALPGQVGCLTCGSVAFSPPAPLWNHRPPETRFEASALDNEKTWQMA